MHIQVLRLVKTLKYTFSYLDSALEKECFLEIHHFKLQQNNFRFLPQAACLCTFVS